MASALSRTAVASVLAVPRSSEAKASAAIIGSLPPLVGLIVYLSSPDYIRLLFTERLGNLMLAGCAVWMSLGIFVMSKMISFKH